MQKNNKFSFKLNWIILGSSLLFFPVQIRPQFFPQSSPSQCPPPSCTRCTSWSSPPCHFGSDVWSGMPAILNILFQVLTHYLTHTRLFIWTSVWVLRTPNASLNMLFQCFFCKKLKKEEKASNLIPISAFLHKTHWKSIFSNVFCAKKLKKESNWLLFLPF